MRFLFVLAILTSTIYSQTIEKEMSKSLQIQAHFLEVSRFIPEILLDIRYATSNNFTKEKLYPYARCYLHRDALIALSKVQQELNQKNLRLKIYDGYRPLSMQQKLWDLVQDSRFVANPEVNRGGHPRGTAVDLTLVDHDGNELEMPSPFDTFDERAHSQYPHCSELAKANRELLREVMERHGFIQLPTEWWHFDLAEGRDDILYPASDLSFAQLDRLAQAGLLH